MSGSCFAVSGDGLLLTANHVVEDAAHVEVTFSDGTHMPARVESSSPSTDLALLRVHAGTPVFLALADDPPGLGEDVFAVGFPVPEVLGPSPKFTSGTISSTAGPQGDALFLQTSVPIQPGSSGSALVNDRGEVVGVVTATAAVERFIQATGSLPQNVNYAVKASYAKPLLGRISSASPIATREEAIGRAQAASCAVRATSAETR